MKWNRILTIANYALEEFQFCDKEEFTDDGPLKTLDLIVDSLHSLVMGVCSQVLSDCLPMLHKFSAKIGKAWQI